MPDLLGATNPVPGYDKANINRNAPIPPDKVNIQNSPDLTRVSRADGKTEWQDSSQQGEGRIRYDSNFQTFLQRLSNTPGLTESLSRIFSLKEGVVVRSGLTDGTSEDMAKLMSMLQMDRQQLLDFLMGQMRGGSRLGGALFSLLRSAYANASSAAVREDILQFLKNYLDYSSRQHIEGNILRNLSMAADSMPASWAERLREMIAQLNNGMLAGDRQGNLQLLQRGILPYIARYIAQNHDMGTVRDLSTMLALNVARYENAGTEQLLAAFHRLASYGTLRGTLGQIDDEGLLELLRRNQAVDTSAARFADQLAAMAARGLRGAVGAELQQAYQDLVHAMLLNESVYMPLNHYLVPLRSEEQMLFSELWVDPDAENDAGGKGGRGGRSMRLLIKMDVQKLGLFDIVVHSRDQVVDVHIACPGAVSAFSREIERSVTEILTQNSLRPGTVTAARMMRPLTLTEVFPKIFEGMNSINVKI